MPITETVNWFPYSHPLTGGADITNEFISFGLMAGAGAIVLLILLLTRAFSQHGQCFGSGFRSGFQKPSEDEFLLWGLGDSGGHAHIITWFGITYYDQFYVRLVFYNWRLFQVVSASYALKRLLRKQEQSRSCRKKYDYFESGRPFEQKIPLTQLCSSVSSYPAITDQKPLSAPSTVCSPRLGLLWR